MVKLGHIRDIWRYPVKAMAGERLDVCALGEKGLTGDRRWAVRDVARAEVQSCKTRPQLLGCRAAYLAAGSGADGEAVRITLPDGSILDGDDPAVHDRLSALVGRPSTLEPIRPASDRAFYRRHKTDAHGWRRELEATFEREAGEPLPDLDSLPDVLVEHVSVPGSLHLVTPFHLLTTASLAALQAHDPSSDWDARRFRPNVVVETGPDIAGLAEADWAGRRLKIGEAVVAITGPTVRCGAITRAQGDLPFDPGMLRTVVREAAQNCGAYGQIEVAGILRAGDEVLLLD